MIICLTPVKNESWILDHFLRCASLWADAIIVADQGSVDDTPDIARRYPKVVLIENPDPGYDEGARARLLLNAARTIHRGALLIAIDADEVLTSNFVNSPEWRGLSSLSPGTVVFGQRVNVCPDRKNCWFDPVSLPIGFVDDGRSETTPSPIHATRVPWPKGSPTMELHETKILHFQFLDLARTRSKHRWYQSWERVRFPEKRAIQIYRQYNHVRAMQAGPTEPVRREWIEFYEQAGVHIADIASAPPYLHDEQVLALLTTYGSKVFSKMDIWDIDWEEMARIQGVPASGLQDPRSRHERRVHRWLGETQSMAGKKRIRYTQRALRLFGW